MPRKGECTTAAPGERFGRLVVVSADGKSRRCRCDCGNEITVTRTSALTSGNTRSCGCLRREVARATFITHGATADGVTTTEYAIWQTMIQRCHNPRAPKWPEYGGRGITVCEQWRNSFEAFLADMGTRPDGMTLDRQDNDGPYSPDNCRWATPVQQGRNKRNNRVLAYDGRSQTITAWAEELGLSRNTIQTRLRLGWSVERALTEAVHVV